jgi:23S rRNA pseudouridine955/2504/2580 synthase
MSGVRLHRFSKRNEIFYRRWFSETPKEQPRKKADPGKYKCIKVTPDENSMRLDRYLGKKCQGAPYSLIQRLLREKQVTSLLFSLRREISITPLDAKEPQKKALDGSNRVTQDHLVWIPSQYVSSVVPPSRPVRRSIGSSLLQLNQETMQKVQEMIIYKDSDIIAINKPSGLACQGKLEP